MFDYVSRMQSLRKMVIKSFAKTNINTSDRNIKTFKRLKNEVPCNSKKYSCKKSEPPCDNKSKKSKIDAQKTECQKLIAQAFGIDIPPDKCAITSQKNVDSHIYMKTPPDSCGEFPTLTRCPKKRELCRDPCGTSSPKVYQKPKDPCAPKGNPFDPCHGPKKKQTKPKPCWYEAPSNPKNDFNAADTSTKQWTSVNASTAFVAAQGAAPQQAQPTCERLKKSHSSVLTKPKLNTPLERAPSNPFITHGVVSPQPKPRKKNIVKKTPNLPLTKVSANVPKEKSAQLLILQKTEISSVNDTKKLNMPFHEPRSTVAQKIAVVPAHDLPQIRSDKQRVEQVPEKSLRISATDPKPTHKSTIVVAAQLTSQKSNAEPSVTLKQTAQKPLKQQPTISETSFHVPNTELKNTEIKPINPRIKAVTAEQQLLSPIERNFANPTVAAASNLNHVCPNLSQNIDQDVDDEMLRIESLVQPLMPPEHLPSKDHISLAQPYDEAESDPNIPAINANKLEISLSDQQSLLQAAAVLTSQAPPLPKKRDPCDRLKKGFIYDYPKRTYSTYTGPVRIFSAQTTFGYQNKHYCETLYHQLNARSFHTLRTKSPSQPCMTISSLKPNIPDLLSIYAMMIRNMSVDTSCQDTTRKTRPKKGDPPKKDPNSCWEPEKKAPWPDPCVWKPACSGKVNPCTVNPNNPPPVTKFSKVFVRGFDPWTPIPAYHPPPAGICERKMPLYPCPRNPGELPRKQGPCSDMPDPCWHPDLKRRSVCKDPPPCLPLPKKRFSNVDSVLSYMNGIVINMYNVGDF